MLAFSMDRLSGSQIYLVKKYIIECSSLLLLPQGSLTNTQSQRMLMRRATLPMDAKNEVIIDPDFLALGLGGTNMMSMLWTMAMGRQAVGVEMRGDPFLGVHWNLREDLYHQLGLIDQMMLERYGEERLPRRGDGRIFRLAECFYSPETTAGDIVADEIIDSFDNDQHISGTIHHIEFIDDRWRDGQPNRVITLLDPPK